MKFFEQELSFTDDIDIKASEDLKGVFHSQALEKLSDMSGETENIGVMMRIGNEPIVRNVQRLLELSNATLPPETQILFDKSDLYIVVHGIGAIRLKGKARVKELQYHAEMTNVTGAATIDMIPNTHFKEVVRANINFEGAMAATGNVSAKIPDNLVSSLTQKYIPVGGDMKIELSSNASFVGKFTYSVKFPVVQSLGVTSNKCSWVLNPDEDQTPLLGDQLLVQTIAVPKGTKELEFSAYGVIKVDRGLFWKMETKETDRISIKINLA